MLHPRLNRIRLRLLAWYRKNRRDLPWRRTRDPYAIWVAETMLQQTRVGSALPHYRKFLKTLPTIQALDRAPQDKVLALWSGLGYYRRAENLKRAARVIARKYGGKMPRDFDSLRGLPGIGLYTAGALASIAFHRPRPALDANARRVLTRLFAVRGKKELCEIAGRLVPRSGPGDWNQALMELGATVCKARLPECGLCPVNRFCAARRSLCFDSRIPAVEKPKTAEVEWPLVVIRSRSKVLLRRREASGLLRGLWEVPGGERRKTESLRGAIARHLNGVGKLAGRPLLVGELRHSITYRRIRAPVLLLSLSRGRPEPPAKYRWAPLSALTRYPLSSLSLKAIKLAARR